MNTIQIKYVVVSLPRTGTTSILQMFKDLGYGVHHAPGPSYDSFLRDRPDADVLSDTPMYSLSVVSDILEENDYVKFIYLEKPADAWLASMLKVGLNDSFNRTHGWIEESGFDKLSRHNKVDYSSMLDIIESPTWDDASALAGYARHREIIFDLIPADRMLSYSFDQGWAPLCEFTGDDIPDLEIPHMNINTMFDKLK